MKLSLPAKKMCQLILLATAIIALGGAALCLTLPAATSDDIVPVVLGVLLSSATNLVKVLLLEYQVNQLGTMEDAGKARLYAAGHSILRLVLTAGSLVGAHFIPFTNLYGAIAGAFTWHIAAFALKYVNLETE